MALTFKQYASYYGITDGSGNLVNAAVLSPQLGAAVASGSALVACAFWGSNTKAADISDTLNGAWTPITPVQQFTSGAFAGYSLQGFAMLAPAAGTPTITCHITAGGSTDMGVVIYEFTGFTGTRFVDGTPTYSSILASPYTTTGVTTTSASSAFFAMHFCQSGMQFTPPGTHEASPWTPNTSGSGDGVCANVGHGYYISTSPQTARSVTFTPNGTNPETMTFEIAISDTVGSGTTTAKQNTAVIGP